MTIQRLFVELANTGDHAFWPERSERSRETVACFRELVSRVEDAPAETTRGRARIGQWQVLVDPELVSVIEEDLIALANGRRLITAIAEPFSQTTLLIAVERGRVVRNLLITNEVHGKGEPLVGEPDDLMTLDDDDLADIIIAFGVDLPALGDHATDCELFTVFSID